MWGRTALAVAIGAFSAVSAIEQGLKEGLVTLLICVGLVATVYAIIAAMRAMANG